MHKTTAIAPTHPASEEVVDEELAPLTLHDRLLIGLSLSSRYIALLAAWVATCGSLFMSEVLLWQPCVLCWYQRILMYPLSILIAVGILRRDQKMHLYILPLSLFGAAIGIYHYAITKNLLPPPPCTSGIPCTTGYLNWFGFINVPFLSLTAFVIISIMMMISATVVVEDGEEQADEATPAAHWLLRFGPVVPVVAIIVGVVGSFVAAGFAR